MGVLTREQEKAMFASNREDFRKIADQGNIMHMREGAVPQTNPHVVSKFNKFFEERKAEAIEKRGTKNVRDQKKKDEKRRDEQKIMSEGLLIQKQNDLVRELKMGKISRQDYDEKINKLRRENSGSIASTRVVLPSFESDAGKDITKAKEILAEERKTSEKKIMEREEKLKPLKQEIENLKERLNDKDVPAEEKKHIAKELQKSQQKYDERKNEIDSAAKVERRMLHERENELNAMKTELDEEGNKSKESALAQRERDFNKIRGPISIMPSGTGYRRVNPETGDYDSRLTYEEQKELGVDKPTMTVPIKEGHGKYYNVEVPVISVEEYRRQKNALREEEQNKAYNKVKKDEAKQGVVDVSMMTPEQRLAFLSLNPRAFQ